MTRERGFMDFGLFRKVVSDAKDCGIERFNLWIMGEPFLHPNFIDFVRFAKENNIKLSLITNGSLLADVADEFFSLTFSEEDELLISCLTSDMYAFGLRKTKKIDYQSYEKGIYGFIERKLEVGSKIKLKIIYLINIISDIVDIPGLIINTEGVLKTLDTWRLFAEELQRRYNVYYDYQFPNKSEIKKSIRKKMSLTFEFIPGVYFDLKWLTNWGKVILPNGLKVIPAEYGYCAYPFEIIGVFWNGDVTFCCDDYNAELVIGNIKQRSLLEIYNGEEIRRIQSEINKGILSKKRCQICQGIIVNKDGRILRKYYKKYFLERIYRHFKIHGFRKTIRKIIGEIKGQYLRI